MAVQNPDELRMSLGEHLEELRYRLILGLVGPVIFAIILLAIGTELIEFLCQPLFIAQARAGIQPQIYITGPQEAFLIYMKIAFIGGLVIGLPWMLWQLWQFVAPGLYPSERRLVNRLAPFSAVLMAIGLMFLYYIMLPFVLWFFIDFTTNWFQIDANDLKPTWVEETLVQETEKAPDGHVDGAPIKLPLRWNDPIETEPGHSWVKMPEGELRFVDHVGNLHKISMTKSQTMITPLFKLDEYISMVLMLALAHAIAFQLPLIMLIVGWTGIITHTQAAAVRKFALLGAFVVGAFLTPADPMSMIALAVPLYGLYEFGIVLMRVVGKRHDEYEDDDDEWDDDDDADEDETDTTLATP